MATSRAERVLIIEHDRAIADLLRLDLEEAGHHVRAVLAPAGVCAEVDCFGPTILFLDPPAPSGEGLDDLRRLHETSGDQALRVVAMTTSRKVAAATAALGARTLFKPFDPGDLARLVERA